MNFFDWLSSRFGTYERPSPSDIIKEEGIGIIDMRVIVDFSKEKLNIPFTRNPRIISIMGIPNTNSMDGVFDYGNNLMQIEAVDEENHKIMVDYIADEWLGARNANDCVYRIMKNVADKPRDFLKPSLFYAIHRVERVGFDNEGRYFIFKGINNPSQDPYKARDKNILWLSCGIIY